MKRIDEIKQLEKQIREAKDRIAELRTQGNMIVGNAKLELKNEVYDTWQISVKITDEWDDKIRVRWQPVGRATGRNEAIMRIEQIINDLEGLYNRVRK